MGCSSSISFKPHQILKPKRKDLLTICKRSKNLFVGRLIRETLKLFNIMGQRVRFKQASKWIIKSKSKMKTLSVKKSNCQSDKNSKIKELSANKSKMKKLAVKKSK
jgi:hypothetical protein